ncbi:uncharacterized protein [Musca autumnalis]|uniref:uncharacterized protein n=1 Tax=Musca autumnalis TaxID=221902 RepID=UPI003CF8099E
MIEVLKYFLIFLHVLLKQSWVRGARYEFLLENDAIFDVCPDIPGNNGIHDLLDMKDLTIEYREGSVNVNGNVTTIWEGVDPTDIVRQSADLLKFRRGDWQPTLLSMKAPDFCSVQFDPTRVWYQTWAKHIPKEDRKCLNVYGNIYHYNDVTLDTIFDFGAYMEGRYKIVTRFNAIDRLTKQQRPKAICFQMLGEFIKVK